MYAEARASFQRVRGTTAGEERELVTLRIAECDYFLKRPRSTRDLLRPLVDRASRQAEALHFYSLALRDLGFRDEYLRLVRRLVDEFPKESWSEEALNTLATRYIVQDADAKADETLREMYEKFPSGRYAERAAWKIGWLAYRNGLYAETARIFEGAAARFPRSDYRPPWLYWSARARAALKESALAEARDTLVATDYLHSYYGRLALTHLNGRAPQRRLIVDQQTPASSGGAPAFDREAAAAAPLPPNEKIVRALVDLGLYDQAVDELRYAQRTWGDSSAIQATLAWIYQKQGQAQSGAEQFALYRSAVNTMRRAYPQFMAAGGESLPADVLRVIFPIDYWDLIRKHAAERKLDPYLVAALVAQESTFVPDIRSSAKAVGLMQLMPQTARQYARRLKMKYSSRLLTSPEANIRMGTLIPTPRFRL
jgi:soluble lytic murein transglycosylase